MREPELGSVSYSTHIYVKLAPSSPNVWRDGVVFWYRRNKHLITGSHKYARKGREAGIAIQSMQPGTKGYITVQGLAGVMVNPRLTQTVGIQ